MLLTLGGGSGFVQETYDAQVNGIVRVSIIQPEFKQSDICAYSSGLDNDPTYLQTWQFQAIVQAHKDIQPSKVYLTEGTLDDASINRSPTSYLANPLDERNRYSLIWITDDFRIIL